MDKIRIGPIDYKIEFVEDLRGDEGQRMSGVIKYGDAKILLRSGMDPQSTRLVLWHEVIHGILTQAGILEKGEDAIEVLAHGIMGVIRDNPGAQNADLRV